MTMDVENIVLADETPEADAIEQHLAVEVDNETGPDSTHLGAIGDRDANYADLIDQAIIVRDSRWVD
ncbi:MAG: hypothetical protein JOY55_18125 [Mycobacterium sp.]|jgi:hypothetical protein|nr:hypothetical protein [Mycobacterium sp.]MBV8293693.1 hypothetical protein [Mycobacterium sp.]